MCGHLPVDRISVFVGQPQEKRPFPIMKVVFPRMRFSADLKRRFNEFRLPAFDFFHPSVWKRVLQLLRKKLAQDGLISYRAKLILNLV
jgi:hypothetical protein